MPEKLNIGGQAVIEGIMIKSPKYNVIAVRKKNKIITKEEKLTCKDKISANKYLFILIV